MKPTEHFAEISGGDLATVISFFLQPQVRAIGYSTYNKTLYFWIKRPSDTLGVSDNFVLYPEPIKPVEVYVQAEKWLEETEPMTYEGDDLEKMEKSFRAVCVISDKNDFVSVRPKYLFIREQD